VIQFDEPAFNVYMDAAAGWGIEALHRPSRRVMHKRGAHLLRLRIPANIEWKSALGAECGNTRSFFRPWRKAESTKSRSNASIRGADERAQTARRQECADRVIDVATDKVETPEEVAAVILKTAEYVPAQKIIAGTNCGMAPMRREIAAKKLEALGLGAALARKTHG